MAHACVPAKALAHLADFLLEQLLIIFVLLGVLHDQLSETWIDVLSLLGRHIFPLLVSRLWPVKHTILALQGSIIGRVEWQVLPLSGGISTLSLVDRVHVVRLSQVHWGEPCILLRVAHLLGPTHVNSLALLVRDGLLESAEIQTSWHILFVLVILGLGTPVGDIVHVKGINALSE